MVSDRSSLSLWRWHVDFGTGGGTLESLFFATEPEIEALCGQIINTFGVVLIRSQFTEIDLNSVGRTLAGIDLLGLHERERVAQQAYD